LRTKLYDKEDYFNFPLWTIQLHVPILQQHLLYHSADIPELAFPIKISLKWNTANTKATEPGVTCDKIKIIIADGMPVSQMTSDMFCLAESNLVCSSFVNYHWIF